MTGQNSLVAPPASGSSSNREPSRGRRFINFMTGRSRSSSSPKYSPDQPQLGSALPTPAGNPAQASDSLTTAAHPSQEPLQPKPAPVTTLASPTKEPPQLWNQTLEIVKRKLSINNTPFSLDGNNLHSKSATENIQAIIQMLEGAQKDEQKRRLRFPGWHGKEIVVVERLGTVLKTMDKYATIVDVAIQHSPEVTSLVWAGVRGILQVRIIFFC